MKKIISNISGKSPGKRLSRLNSSRGPSHFPELSHGFISGIGYVARRTGLICRRKYVAATFILMLLYSLIPIEIHPQTEYAGTYSPDSCTSRPVTGSYSLTIGSKSLLATYLSPLTYRGTSFGLLGTWSKALPFNPRHMIMHFEGSAALDNLWNPARTAKIMGLNAGFKWGMSWRTTLPQKIQLTAGGCIDLDGGAYYLLRNGNNPVQAMASASVDARASLSRPFRIGTFNFLISDVVNIPSLGLFFSPEYGETYYEIYLGNRSGLVHTGWWGNNFRIDNLLSVTIDFGKTAAILGYRLKADTQWANSLNTKILTHSFVIGIIPGGIGLKKRTVKLPSETIYSLY